MTNATRKSRARPGSRWALGRTPSKHLAAVWGVTPSRARHRRTEGDNCVVDTCALIETPEIDGAAIVTETLSALERRYMEEAKESPAKLREKLDRLINRDEHFAQARQDQALQTGEGVNEALLEHARMLIQIAAIRRVLGMEDDR